MLQIQFNINFTSEQEKLDAYLILHELRWKIQKNNRLYGSGERNFLQTLYDFSHQGDTYFASCHLGALPHDEQTDFMTTMEAQCQNLKTFKDWAEEGKLTSVLDQKNCSSSFMFTGIGVLESYAAINSGNIPKKLSIQNTLKCVKEIAGINLNGFGCSSGRPEWIWKYSREKHGLVSDDIYDQRYNADPSEACVSDLLREENTEVDHWVQIAAGDEEAMKCHVANIGPLAVEMTVGFTSLSSYKSGVWDDPENNCHGREIDHVRILKFY